MSKSRKFFQCSFLSLSLISFVSPLKATAFPDSTNHWAAECIEEMSARNLVTGYPNGNFRPQGTITRTEFAVLMLNAFPDAPIQRGKTTFRDVPSNYWGFQAIQDAYQRAFFTGYPGGIFQPHQPIPRVQAIAVLADAIDYPKPNNANSILNQYYQDAAQIPNYARSVVAAASINNLVVNYPQVRKLNPNLSATRGEVAALLCRGLHIDTLPPQYIAGIVTQPQQVRPLPGKLNNVPVFNSNSPELVRTEGILLSTFPPTNKSYPNAHLNYAFQGRFDIFSHHIARAETASQTHPLYQGILLYNPSNQPISVEVLQAASYLSNPDAPFITLPDLADNSNGNIYSGPGGRVMGDILQGVRQDKFPQQITIPPTESSMLLNQAIPVNRAPASNGRSTMIRLRSNGAVYVANLAKKAPRNNNGTYRPPTLAEWQKMVTTADLAGPRDSTPTPLNPPKHPTVFGRVAGVSQGSLWEARITDENESDFSIPTPGKSISYVLGTIHLITLGTGQIQSAPMLKRYADTAYFAHSNYGVEYHLVLPLKNNTNQPQTVNISWQTPIKDEGGTERLLFTNSQDQRIFFRGTVKLTYQDEKESKQTRYYHLVQRRGQQGEPLLTLNLLPNETKEVQVDFIYPPDVTPPQVLTIETLSN